MTTRGPRDAEAVALVHGADEVVQHALGDVEVGDDAVLERADGDDVRGRTADHALGLGADRQHLLGDAVDRDDAGLVDDDAAALDHDKRVRGTEVDTDVVREEPQERADGIEGHAVLAFSLDSSSQSNDRASRS